MASWPLTLAALIVLGLLPFEKIPPLIRWPLLACALIAFMVMEPPNSSSQWWGFAIAIAFTLLMTVHAILDRLGLIARFDTWLANPAASDSGKPDDDGRDC